MDISVVIPLYNEEESLPELTSWIEKVMKENGFSYEILFIDDGSTDKTWERIQKFKNNPQIILHSKENGGKLLLSSYENNLRQPIYHINFRQQKTDEYGFRLLDSFPALLKVKLNLIKSLFSIF